MYKLRISDILRSSIYHCETVSSLSGTIYIMYAYRRIISGEVWSHAMMVFVLVKREIPQSMNIKEGD